MDYISVEVIGTTILIWIMSLPGLIFIHQHHKEKKHEIFLERQISEFNEKVSEIFLPLTILSTLIIGYIGTLVYFNSNIISSYRLFDTPYDLEFIQTVAFKTLLTVFTLIAIVITYQLINYKIVRPKLEEDTLLLNARLGLSEPYLSHLFYEGVSTEIITRWGMLQIFIYVLGDLLSFINILTVWISIILSSVGYTLIHLSFYINVKSNQQRSLVITTVIMDLVISIGFGIIFLNFGLIYAIFGHIIFQTVLWLDRDSPVKLTNMLLNKATHHRDLGEFDIANEYLEKSLYVSQTTKDVHLKGVIYEQIGELQTRMGNLNYAETFIEQAIQIYLSQRDKISNGRAHLLLGSVYHRKGLLDDALAYYQFTLKSFESLFVDVLRLNIEFEADPSEYKGDKRALAILGDTMNRIGRIYQSKGDPVKSLKFMERSYEIRKRVDNLEDISESLFDLTHIYLVNENPEEAKTVIDELEQLSDLSSSKMISLRYELALATYFKHKRRMIDMAEALKIFTKVGNSSTIDHELTIYALINKTELLLAELRLNDSEIILTEINEVTSHLFSIATIQNLYPLMVECHLLRSRITLVEGNIKLSKVYLDKAAKLAIEYGLKTLIDKVSKQKDTIHEQIKQWKDLAEKSDTVNYRIEKSEIEEYIGNMIKVREGLISRFS